MIKFQKIIVTIILLYGFSALAQDGSSTGVDPGGVVPVSTTVPDQPVTTTQNPAPAVVRTMAPVPLSTANP